jgi:hypothetical protein
MAAPHRLALVALLFAPIGLRADEPAKTRSLDPAKLPPNAVIIVSDKPADALQNVEAVVLTPEEYKKLLEAAEKARRLATPDKPEPPSICRLSGKIDSRGGKDVAVLRAEFRFRTTAPRSAVLLGLQKGKPVAATIDDGKLALLTPVKDEDGFALQVDAAGEHGAVVDLEVPVTAGKGGERAVELGLPGAAITTIRRLDLPAEVKRVRLGGRTYAARQFAAGSDAAPAFLLGPTQKLELGWDGPPAGQSEPQTVVDGRYDVRVDEHSLTTRARLTLKVQSGLSGVWQIQAPPTAEVTADGTSPESPVRIEKPSGAGKPWVVRREPSAVDLVLDVTARSPVAAGQPTPVPPFAVTGAFQQRGTISVGGPPHLRVTFRPAADVTRHEATEAVAADPGSRAMFAFFRLPETGSPLAIEFRPARGDVETQIAQQLTLAERGWRWQAKFDVRPVRTEVTAIDLEVPAELQDLRPTSAELVEGVTPLPDTSGTRRLVRIQLAEAHRKPFAFSLEGLYPVDGSLSAATLPLPRPVGSLDRGGQVTATVPAGLELRGSYRDWEGDRPGEWDRPLDPVARPVAGVSDPGQSLIATVERTPARVDLSWRTPRADVPVAAAVDIQLGERQATVRHQWHIPTGPTMPRQLIARGPAALAGRLRAIDGGILTPVNPGEWLVQLSGPASREAVLTLAYSFPTPAGPRGENGRSQIVSVPLVWLEPCPRCETEIRVYSAAASDGGLIVPAKPDDGPWTELAPRAVPDRPALPDLTLHGSGTHVPLTLRITEAAGGPAAGLVVERTCVQVLVEADGRQAYRTRCQIRPQQTHYLQVELPAPPAAAQFVARLDGKRLPWTAETTPGGRTVRLRLDASPDRPSAGVSDAGRASELELVYLLPPSDDRRWTLTLTPPRLPGPVFAGPVRWQIGVAADRLLLACGGDARFDWRWDWRRGLLAPCPAWAAADPNRGSPFEGLETALVGWQSTAVPLTLLVVPRPLALLLGSLVVVTLGLAAVRAGPALRAVGAVVLSAGLAWLAIARPQLFATLLYTAEPGAVVLIVMLLTRLAAQRRYRRRVLFLPATANGSAHAGSASRRSPQPRREPTTIDAPQAIQ